MARTINKINLIAIRKTSFSEGILAASVVSFFVFVCTSTWEPLKIAFKFSHKVCGWNSSDVFEDGHHYWTMCQLTIGEKHAFFTKKPFMECTHIFAPIKQLHRHTIWPLQCIIITHLLIKTLSCQKTWQDTHFWAVNSDKL